MTKRFKYTKHLESQKSQTMSSSFNKVTTSVAHFFRVSLINALKNFVKIFDGGSPQDIMMEKFQEWKDEETISGKKLNFQVGQRVIINNVSSFEKYRGFHVGDVAKIVALINDNGVEKLSLFNPKWIAVDDDLGLGFVTVDPQACMVEIIGVKSGGLSE